MVITMAKLRMAHASTHGARKPPGPKYHSNRKVGGGTVTIFSGVTRSEIASNLAYVSQVQAVYCLPV